MKESKTGNPSVDRCLWFGRPAPFYFSDFEPSGRPVYLRRSTGKRSPEAAFCWTVAVDRSFTERSTGEDSVLYRVGDRYRLAQARPKPDRLGPLPAAITLSDHRAPVLTLAEAIGRLEWLGQPFVFFVNPETARASLLYHRFDGHYGLVDPE